MLLRVRIAEHERAFHQRFSVIQREPLQELITLRIDEYFYAPVFKDLVGSPRRIFQLKLVAQPRTSAADYAEPHSTLDLVLFKQSPNTARCLRCYFNHVFILANLDWVVQFR